MNDFERDEGRLGRVLAAVRAPADPAVLARVRARIAASVPVPRAFAWLGTPAALAGACATLLVAAGLTLAALDRDAGASHDTSLVSALIGDDGSEGLPSTSVGTTTDGGSVDTGQVKP
jgi:hypothetical protein